jgi:hypothetical protein
MTALTWLDDETLRVGDVEFLCRTLDRVDSTADRFFLAKRPDLVERYAALLTERRPATVVELGVFQGGSVAFAATVGAPDTLLAFEFSPDRIAALDEHVARAGLTDRVRIHYGVDQGDRATLTSLLAADGIGPDRPIDLVVDDASHLVGPTRASFEVLFPLLAPGGRFVVEDWAWAHVGFGLHLPDEQPLSTFVVEAALASASRPDVIAEVAIDRDWAVITKGDADLPTDGSFRIADICNGRSKEVVALLEAPFTD